MPRVADTYSGASLDLDARVQRARRAQNNLTASEVPVYAAHESRAKHGEHAIVAARKGLWLYPKAIVSLWQNAETEGIAARVNSSLALPPEALRLYSTIENNALLSDRGLFALPDEKQNRAIFDTLFSAPSYRMFLVEFSDRAHSTRRTIPKGR